MSREPLGIHVAAVALIRGDAGVLMVESRYPDTPQSFWALPGGMVDPGEDLTEALIREVREETGLVASGPMVNAALIWLRTDEGSPDWVTCLLEPTHWEGEVHVDDPDGVTVQAAFMPTDEAERRLLGLRWGLGEPIVQRLNGAAVGSVWTYRWDGRGPWDGGGPAELISGPEVNPS